LGADTTSIRVEVNLIPFPADATVMDCGNDDVSYPNPFQESWFFLIDDYPNANWGHPCRYVWVDTQTGNYEVVDAEMCPLVFPEKVEQWKYVFGVKFPWEVGVEKTSWGEIKAKYKQ
jgi:hypothetical protein